MVCGPNVSARGLDEVDASRNALRPPAWADVSAYALSGAAIAVIELVILGATSRGISTDGALEDALAEN